eukprot:1167567-Pleurochrysis_carterae.AAC.3
MISYGQTIIHLRRKLSISSYYCRAAKVKESPHSSASKHPVQPTLVPSARQQRAQTLAPPGRHGALVQRGSTGSTVGFAGRSN